MVESSSGELCYRGEATITELQMEFTRQKIGTLKSALDYAFKKHAHKNALGTRRVLKEMDELQKNGKVFKKVRMWIVWNTFILLVHKLYNCTGYENYK